MAVYNDDRIEMKWRKKQSTVRKWHTDTSRQIMNQARTYILVSAFFIRFV